MLNTDKRYAALLAACGVVACVLGLVMCVRALQKIVRAGAQQPEFKLRVGERLPDFELSDLNGKVWRSVDLKGKAVYMNVWASW